MKADIKAIHEKSRRTYGERRIKDDLALFYDESGETHQSAADQPLDER
ncbi:transposase [Endozoicomonas sp. SCSIO W0465]|nr:transposase [Endozoicomonas sp. SCSIO W0465]USE39886.1 transposase [Endozoicomonas sp. SCSIO W0465]